MSRKRLRFLCTLALSAITSVLLHAQDTLAPASPVTERTWAVQFGIRNNFTLSSFQGGTISVQHNLSPASALRLGVTLNGAFNDGTSEDRYVNASNLTSMTSVNNGGNSQTVGLDVAYLWYVNPGEVLLLYVGTGPHVSYNHSTGDQTMLGQASDNTWQRTMSTATNTSWGMGDESVLGAEWYPARWVSLHAEYEFVIQHEWNRMEGSSPSSVAIMPASHAHSFECCRMFWP